MHNELHEKTVDMYKRRLLDQERQFELDRADHRDALLSLQHEHRDVTTKLVDARAVLVEMNVR